MRLPDTSGQPITSRHPGKSGRHWAGLKLRTTGSDSPR